MPKIKDYPQLPEFSGNEIFLVESPDGTRNYTFEQLKKLILDSANEVSELSHFTELTGTVTLEQIEPKKIYLVGTGGAEFTDGEQVFVLSENDILLGSPDSGVIMVTATGAHYIAADGANDFDKSNYVTQDYLEKLFAAKEQPQWRKICTDILSDDAVEYQRTEDENGNPLNLSAAKVVITTPTVATLTSGYVVLHTNIDVDSDYEQSFEIYIAPAKFATTALNTYKINVMDVETNPFLKGFLQYAVDYCDLDDGNIAISSTRNSANQSYCTFNFSSVNNIDILRIYPDENKKLPKGMKVELWGVDTVES